MSGAQSWSVKGIDPKVREAAREAAARQGLSLGEYLNQALAKQHGGGAPVSAPPVAGAPPRLRSGRMGLNYTAETESDDDDWHVGAPSLSRTSDPSRLNQRVESIERRTQLAVTGLDRAVSTIDRSVLGLAARIEDAESIAQESADRIADALEQFRIAGETLSGRLERAEYETVESRKALDSAHGELSSVKQRLEQQVVVAEEVARRAEAAASYLTTELENRDVSAKQALSQTLAQARAVAEEAARQATQASADAVAELRDLQIALSERLTESEASTRAAISAAVKEVDTNSVREALLEEVVRLEGEIASRVGSVDQLRSEQAALIARIERAEAGAREATAGLRQAAGAAIADLRNSQLTLSARVKQVEDVAGASGAIDLGDLRHAQADIAERLKALETKADSSPVTDALAAFERRINEIENGGAVQKLDDTVSRLANRIAETESTANSAIRTLEDTVSALGARIENAGAIQETEAVRAMLEQRLDTMAQSVSHMVVEAREELAGQLAAALDGVTGEGFEGALADVNRRLAAAERRQAQTIEAISLEIKRMSETVDKRLRTVETRNDDAAASAVREELSRMATTLEHRFDEIERREAAGFDRMGLEVGRLSERLEERVGAVEVRSAQAIEHVGEQVARMAERFNQRHEVLARDLGERMIDSEERAGARVSDAISSIMHRLAEVEERSAEAIAPVQKAVSSVANKLEHLEHGGRNDDAIPTPSRRNEDLRFPQTFSEPEPYTSPRDAAQPVRAAPLPPRTETPLAQVPNEHDIYFAEDVGDDLIAGEGDDDLPPFETSTFETADQTSAETELSFTDESAHSLFGGDDLLIEDAPTHVEMQTSVTPPPADDDPFWTPEMETTEFVTDTQTDAPSVSDFDLDLDLDLDATYVAPSAAPDVPLSTFDAPAGDIPLATHAEPAPPGKNDYLANARKAAQAQSLPKTRKDEIETPKLSLRGPSRVVLWAGTGLVAAALLGGLWYVSRPDAPAETTATPEAEPTHVLPSAGAPSNTYPSPVQDPFAEAPAEGMTSGAPEAPANDTPLAQAAPTPSAPATQQASNATQPVVAGPLAPRSQSLEQAAQAGNLVAQYELALQRIAAGRTADGVTMMRRAADRGLAMAQYRMAKIYERGEGVTADLNVARQWTERAAAGGNRRAMHDLGVYFARGEGAPLDEAAAFRWFRQAAELGVADSQYNLGVLYQQGRGVNAAPSEALFWFLVAARQGDQDAAARATALEGQLAQIHVDQARARSQAFRPRAASAVANGEFGARPWAARPAA
jgi:localization factor PodJL